MNYEKKYKNALEWARKVKQGKVGFVLDDVLETFPELKESEDERTWLINYLSNRILNSSIIAENENFKKAIAWLEKQGEQKPDEKVEPKFKVGDAIRLKNSNAEYIIESISDGHYYGKGFSISIVGGNRDYELVEQKPKEYAKGEDYGIDGLYNAIRILEKTLGKVDGYQTDDGILEHECAISAVKKLYEQKPTIWSKEDEEHVNSLLKRLEGLCRNEFATTRFAISEDKDWLKSLKSQNTWKPSDEQMDAMQKALVDLCGKDEHNIITGLYYDLKKLKG